MRFHTPSPDQYAGLMTMLVSAGHPVALDLETTGLNPRQDKILKVVLANDREAWVCEPDVVQHLDRLTGLIIVLQNFKFDAAFLRRAGYALCDNHVIVDVMLLHHLLDENATSHSLDAMVLEEFGESYKAEFWAKYKNFTDAPVHEQIEYAGKDGVFTAKLYHAFYPRLAEQRLLALATHVHQLAISLHKTEQAGLAVDLPRVMQVGGELTQKIAELLPRLREAAKSEIENMELTAWMHELDKRKTDRGKAGVPRPVFSFNSPIQLRELLYSRLGLPAQHNEKTREVSTDERALTALAGTHPIIDSLREYRDAKKIFGTYIEGTLEHAVEGRVYPTFNVNGTATGRISHASPNLGNLPREGGIRSIYVPDPGEVWISADYAQLEIVVAAHFSRDKNLLRIVLEGASQHDITAESLGIPRSVAKTVNFAVQYGAGLGKVAKILNCSKVEAELALKRYWTAYSGLKALMDEVHGLVDQGRDIVNPFGRRRRLPRSYVTIYDKYRAQRQAFNFLIQSTGSDLTSIAFYQTDQALRAANLGRALFTVHDEVLVATRPVTCAGAADVLASKMREVGNLINLSVPLNVAVSQPMSCWED